jgi:mono/diheme cytochrome c family protein
MTAITRVARTTEASEPRERPAFAPKALRRVHRSFSEGGSGDRGVPASERVGGAGGAKPPGQRMQRVRRYVFLAAVPMLTMGLRLDARQERDAGGLKAPTAALERGRAVYVLNHCHFCHGVDLTQATMGAANLSQSPLVGADEDGNMIGPLVKAGLPNLQTAMPSYAELTSEEIVDLARYVHFLRQQARFRELSRLADTPAGDRTTGEAYFNGAGNCRSCHSVTRDLAGVGRKYDTATLRSRLLRPGPAMPSEGVSPTAGQAAHLKLLENYTAANVQDLVAYLGASR